MTYSIEVYYSFSGESDLSLVHLGCSPGRRRALTESRGNGPGTGLVVANLLRTHPGEMDEKKRSPVG